MELKSNIKEVDEVTRVLTVTIPANDVQREVDAELAVLSKKARVKGFRPGKAPQNVVAQQHGNRVHMEVAHRMISATLQNLVQEHKFDMVGEPEIDISSFEPGKDIEYIANIALFPNPEVAGYEAFEVKVPRTEVANEDVDKAIEQIRLSRATPRKLEFRITAEEGDIIDGLLEVHVEGEEPSRPEPLVVELNRENLPVELVEGIVGMEVGSTREIQGKLPASPDEDTQEERAATFKVTLNLLSEKVLPELSDEFAEQSGLEVKTLLELRTKVREQLESQQEESEKSETHAAILDCLLESNEFAVPLVMVDNEIRNLLARSGMVDPEKTPLSRISVESFREQLGETAEKRVRTAVLVDRIAETEKLQATSEEVNSAMQMLADQNNLPLEEVKNYFRDEGRALSFTLEQTRNKVLEFLESRTQVEYVKPVDKEDADKEG